MKHAVLVLLLAACGAAQRPPAARDVSELEWLVGTWQTEDLEPLGEAWTRDGARLSGVGYAMRPTDCAAPEPGFEAGCESVRVDTETLEVIARDGDLFYIATPSGQTRTEFRITEVDADHFVAENPEHDFPTRIEYRRELRGIRALVSSTDQGFELLLLPIGEASDIP